MAKGARLMDAPKEPPVEADTKNRRRALELILRERRRLLEGALISRGASPDPIEVAQELEEERVWLAVLDKSHETQVQVDEAMHLLAEGRYGQCVNCGRPIAPRRLRALPFALRCLPCQERFESRRKSKEALAPSMGWSRPRWE